MIEIRYLRKSIGWTQAQLAERLGVSQATVSRWEDGDARERDLLAVGAVIDAAVADMKKQGKRRQSKGAAS